MNDAQQLKVDGVAAFRAGWKCLSRDYCHFMRKAVLSVSYFINSALRDDLARNKSSAFALASCATIAFYQPHRAPL